VLTITNGSCFTDSRVAPKLTAMPRSQCQRGFALRDSHPIYLDDRHVFSPPELFGRGPSICIFCLTSLSAFIQSSDIQLFPVVGLLMNQLYVSAPGRICLFGEHQDYLGLPVIAAAISLRIGITAQVSSNCHFRLSMPDIGVEEQIDIRHEQRYCHARDYLRSSINVLRREGITWPRGFDIHMHGEIPINAGTSSSSAMVVMWLRFLLETGQPPRSFTLDDLARWGHRSEVLEFGEPGGMMDHYCAAKGGVLWIDTRPPFAAESWDTPLNGIVLGNSLQPKATLETLGMCRRDLQEGVALLLQKFPAFDLAKTPLEEAEPFLKELPPLPARRVRANLINRDLTLQAKETLQRGDLSRLGALLYAHHEQLRDGLDLSTDKIERMLDAAMAAGAQGGKINGSGGGGCMFAYAPGHEEAVAEAIRREGGIPYIVNVDRGVSVEYR
jgi:galactokinase